MDNQKIKVVSIEDTREKLLGIEVDMNSYHINRRDEIHGLLLASVAQEHILFLGPPGTNKTNMVNDFARYFSLPEGPETDTNVVYFYRQLHKFVTPNQIFGPVSIKSFKEDVEKFVIKHKLPHAYIANFDEVYKGSAALLGSFLHIMQEREFENGEETLRVPLMFVVGASNELPNSEDGLGALHDRFTLKYNVEYLRDYDDFMRLIRLESTHKHALSQMDIHNLRYCNLTASNIPFSEDALTTLGTVWVAAQEARITVSDRMWRKLLKIMQVEAFLHRRDEVISSDAVIAKHLLWTTPDQINKVHKLVASSVDPDASRATETLEAAESLYVDYQNKSSIMSTGERAAMMQNLHAMKETVEGLKKSTSVKDALARIYAILNTIQQETQRMHLGR
jgi:MoxR-like ATPase